MDLVFNGSRPETSFQAFPGFAEKIFGRSGAVNKCISWAKCLKGLIKDSQYDGQNLEGVLKEQLGTSRRVFDAETTSCAGPKVALITSRISGGKACVLANYRGIGTRQKDSAYEFLVPGSESENPLLWEV